MADLPLESIAWHAEVTGTVATVTVDHTFRNDTDRVIEGTYVFPLAGDVTLDRVHIEVGSRALESRVVERQVAWSLWDTAKKNRKIVQIPEEAKPYRFRQYLTDIRPGESVHVVLEAVQSVTRHDGGWELALPVDARPRFIQAVPLGDPEPPASPQPHVPLAFDLDVHAAAPIVRAESPTHLAIDGAELQASSDDTTGELVLRWWTATDTPMAGMLVHGEHGLLTLEAPATQAGRMPREIMWVVDTSNLTLAKAAMERTLDGVDPGESVALLTYTPLGGITVRPHAATPANVRRLRRRIDQLDGLGSEGPALLAALRWPSDPARHRVICLLTDGRDRRADEVLAELARHPEVTVYVVTTGGAADALAELSGGVTIPVGGQGPVAAAERVAAALEPPALSELQVDWGGWQLESTFPPRLPDVREGSASTLAVHVSGGSGPVTIRGRAANGTFTQETTPRPIDDGRGMEVLWAKARIAELQARYGPYARNQTSVDTALRWGIETEYTPRILAPVDPESADDLIRRGFFELRVPPSRSGGPDVPGRYSYIPNLSTLGPVGRGFDPLSQLPRPLATPEPATGFWGPLVFSPMDISVGGTDVATLVRLDPVWTTGGDRDRAVLHGTLGLGAPLGKGYTRIAGLASGRYFLGSPVTAEEAGVSLGYHPLSLYNFSASARASRVVAGGSRVYTDAAAGLSARTPFNRKPVGHAWLSAAETSAYGDSRSIVEGGTEVRQIFKWAGSQDIYVQARVVGLDWEATPQPIPSEGSALFVTGVIGDNWSSSKIGLSPRVGLGLLAIQVDGVDRAPALLPAPALRLWWNMTGRGEQLELDAAYDWDTDGLRIGALDDDGRPGRTAYAALTASSRWFAGFQARLGLRAEARRGPLVPRSDIATVTDAADAPWFERQALAANARLSFQVEPVEAVVTWRHALTPWDSAPLLDDPRAAWTPGYLEPWRANVVHAFFALKPRVDPSLLAFAVSAAWAQAVDPTSDNWWLQDQLSVTGSVKGGVPLKSGHAGLQLDVSWSRRDPSLALLPPIVLVHEVSETLEDQGPWRVGAQVEVGF